MVTFKQALETIKRKGIGIHHIKDNFYAFGESWDTICVEKECGDMKDPDEFDKCGIEYALRCTHNKIPKELKAKGYKVLEIQHVEFEGDNMPFGWAVALLKACVC